MASQQWKTWHKVVLGFVGGLLVLVCGIAAIGIALDGDEEPTGDPTVPVEGSEEMPAWFLDYTAALDAIDPGIAAGRDVQALVNDAENTCLSIEQGESEETLVDMTVSRFGVNEAEGLVDEAMAVEILEVTRERCDEIRP